MNGCERVLEIDAELAQLKMDLANVKGTVTEVYTRIVGYYRAVKNWNLGKREELRLRTPYKYQGGGGIK